MTYKEAKARLDGIGKRRGPRDTLKIARNTWLERGKAFRPEYAVAGTIEDYPDNAIGLRFHETYVVVFTPHWTELYTGGWHTRATSDRIDYSNVRVGTGYRDTRQMGWLVYLQNDNLPCFCTMGEDAHPGLERRFTGEWTGEPYDHEHGSEPIYKWTLCSHCDGSALRSGIDYDNGHPFYDGIRVSADGKRLMRSQPHMPDHFEPIFTESGFDRSPRPYGSFYGVY